ncbi:MAG: tetratricopeptide repeat protein [Candidatus Hydrogenedens sp.]
MDRNETITKILECECGAKILPKIEQNEMKGTCPRCGKILSVRLEKPEGEYLSSKDSPAPKEEIPKTVVKLPLPDDGFETTGRSNLTFSSDIKIRSREAATLVNRGKIVEAVALYRWICEENPEHRDAYYGLGFCYYKLGDLNRSRWMLEKAVELEHPSANKLLLKVVRKLEEEEKLKKVSEDNKTKQTPIKEPGEFTLDEPE